EIIRRKPLKPETEGVVTMIGLGLMVLLMLAVTINDIMRYF
ncbi:putative protease eep, partial [Lacticaseibacillus paracasei subsp. paracasei Lpp48]